MLRLAFTQAEARALAHERFHHPHPRVRRKMEALWLKSQGLAHQEVARLAGVSGNTLRSYLRQYAEGGIAALKELHFRRPKSELAAHQATIVAYFREHPPASINEAIDGIRELTGLSRSPTQVRTFLKAKCGMRRLKTGTLPAKGDPDVQEAFKKKELEPRLAEAKDGNCGSSSKNGASMPSTTATSALSPRPSNAACKTHTPSTPKRSIPC